MHDMINAYIDNEVLPSKAAWSKIIWEEVWKLEGQLERSNVYLNEMTSLVKQVIDQPRYLP